MDLSMTLLTFKLTSISIRGRIPNFVVSCVKYSPNLLERFLPDVSTLLQVHVYTCLISHEKDGTNLLVFHFIDAIIVVFFGFVAKVKNFLSIYLFFFFLILVCHH